MSPDDEIKDWEKISKAFFQAPDAKPSNAFVEKVMAKIEPEEEAVGSGESLWNPFFRWLVPTAGAAFAAAAFFLTFPEASNNVTTEDMLYSNSPIQTISTFDTVPEDPAVDQMLEI